MGVVMQRRSFLQLIAAAIAGLAGWLRGGRSAQPWSAQVAPGGVPFRRLEEPYFFGPGEPIGLLAVDEDALVWSPTARLAADRMRVPWAGLTPDQSLRWVGRRLASAQEIDDTMRELYRGGRREAFATHVTVWS